MFTEFFTNLFPTLGYSMGFISAIATEPYVNALLYLLGEPHLPINAIDFFTGLSFVLPTIGRVPGITAVNLAFIAFTKAILSPFIGATAPFWLALLCLSFVFGLGFIIVKFVIGIFI